MKKYFIILIMAAVVGGITSCNNYGTKKMFDNLEVYYTENVTEAEADALGTFLKEQEFTKGDEKKTMQLNKEGDVYQVRMVVKEGYVDDEEMIASMKILAYAFSESVFEGKEVEVHMCNDELETQKVVKMD